MLMWGGGLQPGTALVVICLPVVTLQPSSTVPSVAGCCLVGCCVVSGKPLRSSDVAGVSQRVCVSLGTRAPSPHAASETACRQRGLGRVPIAGWSYGGLGPGGVFGGEEEGGGVRSGPGEARTILLLHIMMMMSFICSCRNKNQPN